MIAGDGGDVTAAAELEDLVLGGRGRAPRSGAAWTPTTRATWTDSSSLPLRGDAAGYARRARPRKPRTRRSRIGPGPMGGFVRCEFAAERVHRPGPSTAPRAVAALAFASDALRRRHRPALRAPSPVR